MPTRPPSLFLLVAAVSWAGSGCDPSQGDDDSAGDVPGVEPLDLPADPAEPGVPVGVRTVEREGVAMEVWYPATDATADEVPEAIDVSPFVPQEVSDLLAGLELPDLPSGAVRGAAVRDPGETLPVVVFSHGFGAFRLQSPDYAVHLASRGYVVVSADHPGRMLADVLPCVFDPALSGCDLSGMLGTDPAVDDVEVVLDWVDEAATTGFLAGRIDVSRLALTGHSAGGATTATVGEVETRYTALIALASAVSVARDVPMLLMGGSCDAYATPESVGAARDELMQGHLVHLVGAGHLAFSDLCELELGTLADEVLAPRDDVNDALLEQLRGLASDGCPDGHPSPEFEDCASGTYLDVGTAQRIVRYYTTSFLDSVFRGQGPGVPPGVFPEADVR